MGFPGGPDGKDPPAMRETWVWKVPWRRIWQPPLVFLPVEEAPRTEEPGGATVHAVSKSRTRLERLSRSSKHAETLPKNREKKTFPVYFVLPKMRQRKFQVILFYKCSCKNLK